MGNSFGQIFRITTWGESHGGAVGVVIDGCPSQLAITEADIQFELDRRRPGQSDIVTPRKESDTVHILSGIFEGKTLGTPISLLVWNKDANPKAYDHLKDVYRPSHADYTFQEKFGIRNWQGGGRSSARETIGRVAAGAIAKKYLQEQCNIECIAYVSQVHHIKASINRDDVTLASVEANDVRCPDAKVATQMIDHIKQARKDGDSLGGIVECVIRHVPVGLGEPVFDKIKADLAKAMMSLPATMGFDIGSGFDAITMKGSEHNDSFYLDKNKVRTSSNFSGGTQGGITNGEDIYFKVAFKPTATIFKEQDTVTQDHKEAVLAAKGRHDPCVIPRAVPIVEAMANLVVMDHLLRQQARS
ncbi:chorismate synthase [Candidatus Marinamargulisbacteria bacterium SCGC AG-414-C22]|nr:chorismate synthase [Candidatus Marinamargulisbacteria bacterium SCGC AG-414-C22]